MERRYFHPILGLLIAFYLLLELIYVQRLPLAMDEFQFASEIERLRTELPYRDFRPYKNLLGYYLQGLPFAAGRLLGVSPWDNLILLKSSIALAVGATLFWSAQRLRAYFAEGSILAATALLVVMSTFLERSAVIRVDMLASLLGLAAAIFVLGGRACWAGAMVGLAFLVTQKAAYFVVAAGLVFAFDLARLRARERSLQRMLVFTGSALVPMILYFAIFSWLSGPRDVWQVMFADSSQVALWQDYADKRLFFWKQTLSRNPVFYAAALVGLAALAFKPAQRPEQQAAIRRFGVFALTLFAFSIWHRQPWPYFFVILIPTAWIAAVAAFDAMACSPLGASPGRQRIALALVLLAGMSLSAARIPKPLARDNAYQRNIFEVLDSALAPDETYLAGTNILYHRPFQPAGVRWLDRRRIAEIEAQSPEERRAFLQHLENEPIKLVVRNYRTGDLPEGVQAYLDQRFRPMFGSLSTHAPHCSGEQGRVDVKFAGVYWLHTSDVAPVAIAGRSVPPGGFIELAAGSHTIEPGRSCRLQFVPRELEAVGDPRFIQGKAFFKDVYTY